MNITNSPDTLTDLLQDYGQPAEIEEVKTEEVRPSDSSLPLSNNAETVTNWQGNPSYFQTGKKAGQLRPIGGNKPKFAYIKSEEISEIDGELITGALFLTLVDLMFPLLIVGLHNTLTKEKSKKLKADSVTLTAEQKRQLSPIADKVVKQIKISANPTTLLVYSMLGLYGMQYAFARMEASLKTK